VRGGFAEGAQGAGRDAAVDEQGLAGDVAAGLRGEEDDGAVEVVRLAGTLDGNAFSEIFDPFGVFVHDLVLLGLKPAWREASKNFTSCFLAKLVKVTRTVPFPFFTIDL